MMRIYTTLGSNKATHTCSTYRKSFLSRSGYRHFSCCSLSHPHPTENMKLTTKNARHSWVSVIQLSLLLPSEVLKLSRVPKVPATSIKGQRVFPGKNPCTFTSLGIFLLLCLPWFTFLFVSVYYVAMMHFITLSLTLQTPGSRWHAHTQNNSSP